MKQTPLLRWIEVAEHARFCLLAEEHPMPDTVDPRSISAQSPNTLLARLREQLYLGETRRRPSCGLPGPLD
jgi:hypothetical protein